MDNSREVTIARFRAQMRDVHLPWKTRARSARAYYRIKRQLKDRTLSKLRHEYMCADAAADNAARESIGERVAAYMYKKYKRRI